MQNEQNSLISGPAFRGRERNYCGGSKVVNTLTSGDYRYRRSCTHTLVTLLVAPV